MRTLHLDSGREMAGGQWQVLYLAERLEGATLMTSEKSPLFGEAKARGIEVRPLSLIALASVAGDFDLVHAHDARTHAMAAAIPGIRLVVARRVAFPVHAGLLSRVKYSRADLYLAVSKCVARQLQAAGIAAERIRVVYDGVPLVEAARGERIVALASKDVEMVKKAAELAKIEVRFTANLWHDLEKAKMFLYASDAEGLGSAALAAMSASVPVIASNVGGLPEAVEHERTGILVANRPEDFAFAIGRFLKNPAMAVEMGRKGRERVETLFTIEIMVRSTMAAYEEVAR